MHHPRAEDLDPARPFAHRAAGAMTDAALDVHLRRRLRERKETWAKARLAGTKEALCEATERRLQIDEAYAFVDAQPFDLHERRRMRRIERILSIRVPRNQHANGWRILLKRAHLHRRRVRAQHDVVAEKERVVRVERRI